MSKEKSYLSQLRLGILPIAIETGRYRQVPISERKCTICKKNEVEDEFHILFKCPAYKNIRLNWLEKLFIDLSSTEESKNMKHIYEIIFHNPKQTAKYLVNLIEIRSKKMSDSE